MTSYREDRPARDDLREATLSGVRSVAGARLGIELLVFGGSLALARLVSPAEFGYAVIALIITGLASTVSPVLFGARLVQRAEIEPRHVRAATSLGIAGGLVLAAGTLLGGVPAAAALFGPETADLVGLAAPAFLIAGIAAPSQAVLQRRLEFRRLAWIELSASATGAVGAVGAAAAGLDATAIVLGALAGVAVGGASAVAAAGIWRPGFDREATWDILRFGGPAGFGSLGYTSFRNVDYAIVGASLGPTQLGAYWRGFQLGVDYQRKISAVMQRIAFPVYSRAEARSRMRAIRTRVVRAHATVIFPLLALLIATAPVLIPFLYGDAWEAAVVPAQILALAGMAAAAQTGIGPLLMAMGRTSVLMAYTWFAVAVYAGAVLIAAPYGLTTVCIAAAAASLVLFLAGSYALVDRIAGIPMRSLVGEVGPALCGCAVLLVVALPMTRLLSDAAIAAPLVLGLAALAGLGVYAVTLRVGFPAAWEDVTLLARRAMRGVPSSPEPSIAHRKDPGAALPLPAGAESS